MKAKARHIIHIAPKHYYKDSRLLKYNNFTYCNFIAKDENNNIFIFDNKCNKIKNNFLFLKKIFKKSLNQKIIFIVHDLQFSPLILILKLFNNITIFDFHENLLLKYKLNFIIKTIINFFLIFVKFYDGVIYATDHIEKSFKNKKFNKGIKIYNYSDLNNNRKKKILKKYDFIYIGYISKNRKITWFLDLLFDINLHYKSNFILCGPIIGKEYAKKIFHHKSFKYTKYLSWSDKKSKIKLLSQSRIGLNLFEKDNLNQVYSFPSKVFEYLSFKLFILTSKLPFLKKEIFTKNKDQFVYDDITRKKLIFTLIRLLKNKKYSNNLYNNRIPAFKSQKDTFTEFLNYLHKKS